MRRFLILATAALTLSTLPAAHAAADPAVDKVLRQLDASSAKFQSAEADLKWDFFEKVVHDTSTQTGSIYFLKSKTGTEMGAVITSPGKKYVHFADGKGEMYDAIAKKNTPFDAGANRGRVESFLALGFGGSGADMDKAWTITLEGTETIDGVSAAKLDLKPKDPSTAQSLTHITMWIDTARDIPLKQVTYLPEGDTRTAYYTNIRYNTKVDVKKYKH
jgi:outer membrane lipoprotein-sorting protein